VIRYAALDTVHLTVIVLILMVTIHREARYNYDRKYDQIGIGIGIFQSVRLEMSKRAKSAPMSRNVVLFHRGSEYFIPPTSLYEYVYRFPRQKVERPVVTFCRISSTWPDITSRTIRIFTLDFLSPRVSRVISIENTEKLSVLSCIGPD